MVKQLTVSIWSLQLQNLINGMEDDMPVAVDSAASCVIWKKLQTEYPFIGLEVFCITDIGGGSVVVFHYGCPGNDDLNR